MSLRRRDVGGVDVKETTWLKELERVNQRLICDFLMSHGSTADAAPCAERAGRQREQLEEARAERSRIGAGERCLAHGLPDEAVAQLGELLGKHHEVAAAYLVRKALAHAPEAPLYVLGVVRRFSLYAGEGAKRLAQELSRELVLPRGVLVVVLTLGSWRLKRLMQGIPDSEIYRR